MTYCLFIDGIFSVKLFKTLESESRAVSDHLLLCKNSPSFENFNVLTKTSLTIMEGK